jgi:hypothetical protein
MRYFIIETLGDDQDTKLAFIDTPPEDLGVYEYCLARGERIGERYPADARIYLQRKSPGIKLSSLIGNTRNYLIVNTEVKAVILDFCGASNLEVLPFTLFNHKKRVHSTEYSIINPIGYVDCVNHAASDIRYLSTDPSKIVAVRKFVLNPANLANAPDLFRVAEDREKYFISERIAKVWQEHNFSNIFLTEVDQREPL